jgi:hypothetical protein
MCVAEVEATQIWQAAERHLPCDRSASLFQKSSGEDMFEHATRQVVSRCTYHGVCFPWEQLSCKGRRWNCLTRACLYLSQINQTN